MRSRPSLGRWPLLAVALLLLAFVVGAPPAGASASTRSAEVLRLLNAARAHHGVPPLRADRRLARAAAAHSRDMVARRYFAHRSRTGERPCQRIARTGWMHGRRHWHVGENLAWGTHRKARPAAIVRAWLHSPPHRRIMLDRSYLVVGVGVVRGVPFAGSRHGRTYTADFG